METENKYPYDYLNIFHFLGNKQEFEEAQKLRDEEERFNLGTYPFDE